MKITKQVLTAIEGIFKENGYKLLYEKGNFNGGYCVVENQKMIVINKFLTLEGRVGVMLDVLEAISIDKETLDTDQQRILTSLQKGLNKSPALETVVENTPA